MTATPSSERIHIALAGACNSGKSSLLNAICRQEVAIVSPRTGTTTDPVRKPMELPGLGACVIVDTPGIDDRTGLGAVRCQSARREFERADIAVALVDPDDIPAARELIAELKEPGLQVVAARNKADLHEADPQEPERIAALEEAIGMRVIRLSAATGLGITELTEALQAVAAQEERTICGNLMKEGDTVLLVMPQDKQAPKGRLILPQVQTIRELLDRGCTPVCCTPERLTHTLESLRELPDLVITDSQAFAAVASQLPPECRLTSFSILMAGYKGDIDIFIKGAAMLPRLDSNSRVLIAEACSHAPQTEDIGRVKLPRILRRMAGEGITIDICGGADFPAHLEGYDLVVHCGGCMFTRRHVMRRVMRAVRAGVPVTNYGILLAQAAGILPRVCLP